MTSRNQVSDWIETANATAVTTTHTDHIATGRSCDLKYATTTALSTLQGEVTVNTSAITGLQSQLK